MVTLEECIEDLKEIGYCRIPGVYDSSGVTEALERVRYWYEESKNSQSDKVPFLNIGQPTVYNLQNKDILFLKLIFEPKIIQDLLVHHLNDRWFKQIASDQPNYILRSLIARSSNTALPMHLDSFIPYLGDHVFVMQFSIVLQKQTEDNGCTVVVPKSHHAGEYATQEAFAEAIPIESEPGDVVIWDSRLWHGTTANHSGDTRWAVVATFCRWWLKQHWNVTARLPQSIYEQLTDSQKAVLGFCSIPNLDETRGIDLKCGHESLRAHVHEYRP